MIDNFLQKVACVMTPQEKDVLTELKKEEEQTREEIDVIVVKIAQKEMEFLDKNAPACFKLEIPKIDREYMLIPTYFVVGCMVDGVAGQSSFITALAYMALGLAAGGASVFQEVRKEREDLRKDVKNFKEEKRVLEEDRFHFDKKQLSFELKQKREDHQRVLAKIKKAESDMGYRELLEICEY